MLTSKTEESRGMPVASDAPTAPQVAISILNWNGWEDTLECLESVRKLDYPNYLTVVVDNGSWNGSADRIRAWAEANLGPGHVIADYSRETALAGGDPETEQALDRAPSSTRIVLIRNGENLGFTGGNNVAIHYALVRPQASDFVFLLNNDARAKEDCLTRLVESVRSSGAAVIEPAVFNESTQTFLPVWKPSRWERVLIDEFAHLRTRSDFLDVAAVRGGAMLIDAKTLRAVQARWGLYLDDRFFMYAEDIQFCYRARIVGGVSAHTDTATVYHKGARSSGGRFNPLEYYYCTRNLLLHYREMEWREQVFFYCRHVTRSAMSIANSFIRRRPKSAAVILSGLVDGLRGVDGKWKRHDLEVTSRVQGWAENSRVRKVEEATAYAAARVSDHSRS